MCAVCKKNPENKYPIVKNPSLTAEFARAGSNHFNLWRKKTAQENRFSNRQCQLLPPLVGAANIVKDQRCQIHSGSNYSGLIKYTAQ
jgi:hypothetical protein